MSQATQADIVVVGGGMAGLYFAWRMLRHRRTTRIAILEMLPRPGGRLHTDIVQIDGKPVKNEEGGMRFAADMDHLMWLLRALDLDRSIMPFDMGDSHNLYHLRGRRQTFGDMKDARRWSTIYHLRPSEQGRQPNRILQDVFKDVLKQNGVDPKAGYPQTPEQWQHARLTYLYRGVPLYQWGFWALLVDHGLSQECLQMIKDSMGFLAFYDQPVNAGIGFQTMGDFDRLPRYLKDETEMGHIQLSREADLVVVAPATADLLGKMAAGLADDLATTLLLATDKPVLAAPAMNVRMWQHAATVRNVARLRADGVTILEPDEGPMACGEYGPGRLPEPEAILAAIQSFGVKRRLTGRHILVTAGPTHEPIDPVRYIANRSSGRQGYAIADALARLGARVTLVSGPVTLPTPAGVTRIDVETAREMADAVAAALPADAAVMVAAVGDWRAEAAAQKLKKGEAPPSLALSENPDILASLAQGPHRPKLVVGFAAETERVIEHATAKRTRKGADWIVANDVSGDVMGGEANTVHLVTAAGVEPWDRLPKAEVARRLAERIADAL